MGAAKNKFHLTDLRGKHILTGVDRETTSVNNGYGHEDCEVIRFCLDGLVYVATEDPEDGYRSCMKDIFIDPNKPIKNTFKPVEVYGKMRAGTRYETNDVIEFWRKDKLILAVGTSNTYDYYPSFVADFHPENIG